MKQKRFSEQFSASILLKKFGRNSNFVNHFMGSINASSNDSIDLKHIIENGNIKVEDIRREEDKGGMASFQ